MWSFSLGHPIRTHTYREGANEKTGERKSERESEWEREWKNERETALLLSARSTLFRGKFNSLWSFVWKSEWLTIESREIIKLNGEENFRDKRTVAKIIIILLYC